MEKWTPTRRSLLRAGGSAAALPLAMGTGRAEGARPRQRSAQAPQREVAQHGLVVRFDRRYQVGQFVTGDWWVVGSPTVTSLSPAWDGRRHGTMVNPGLHAPSGYHSALNYADAANIGTQLPYQLAPGDSLIHTHGWLATDQEVIDRGITVTSNPAAPRPCIRDSLVLTVLAEEPPPGSFRPPYVPGPTWLYTTDDVDWSVLRNVPATPGAPTWDAVEASLARSWAPDNGYGWTTSRYLHPYLHMPDYGRDMCAVMYRAILRLNTEAPLAQKQFTAYKVIQYGIDVLAITRLAIEQRFRISGLALPSWWSDFGGGHGVGRDLPALLTTRMLGNPVELQRIWDDAGPAYWGDLGQIWVSDGDPATDPWRSAGEATWGESAHSRPDTRRPGTTSYRTCCTTTATMGGMLAAHLMGLASQWDHPTAPIVEYTDWYVDVDQVALGTRWPRAWYPWFATMWDTYR